MFFLAWALHGFLLLRKFMRIEFRELAEIPVIGAMSMKPRHPKTMIALAVGAIAINLVAGTALGQSSTAGKGQRNSAAMSAAPPPAASSGVQVTIDPVTGAVTGANGAALVLIPGTTTVVLPTSIAGGAAAISGIAVPANSSQVS